MAKTEVSKKLIDKATGHFEHIIDGGLAGPISVPEWDAEVWYRPTTTLAEESQVIKLTQEGKQTEALVVTLINKARDKNGEKLFDMGDRIKLMNSVDPQIILQIINKMSVQDKKIVDEMGN